MFSRENINNKGRGLSSEGRTSPRELHNQRIMPIFCRVIRRRVGFSLQILSFDSSFPQLLELSGGFTPVHNIARQWFQLSHWWVLFNKNNVHVQHHPTNACVFSTCSGFAVRGVAFDWMIEKLAKRVQMTKWQSRRVPCETRSNENVDAFAPRVKRVRTSNFTRSNENLHAFKRELYAFVSSAERVCVIPCVWRVLYFLLTTVFINSQKLTSMNPEHPQAVGHLNPKDPRYRYC